MIQSLHLFWQASKCYPRPNTSRFLFRSSRLLTCPEALGTVIFSCSDRTIRLSCQLSVAKPLQPWFPTLLGCKTHGQWSIGTRKILGILSANREVLNFGWCPSQPKLDLISLSKSIRVAPSHRSFYRILPSKTKIKNGKSEFWMFVHVCPILHFHVHLLLSRLFLPKTYGA